MKVVNKPAKNYAKVLLSHNRFKLTQDIRNFLFGWSIGNKLMICFMIWTIFIESEENK